MEESKLDSVYRTIEFLQVEVTGLVNELNLKNTSDRGRWVDLDKMQEGHYEWSKKNFHDQPPWLPLLGIVEELGELAHAYIKKYQGIRGTPSEHDENMKDAIADIAIYAMDFCARMGFSFRDCLVDTIKKVHERDWKKNPNDGGIESSKAAIEQKDYRGGLGPHVTDRNGSNLFINDRVVSVYDRAIELVVLDLSINTNEIKISIGPYFFDADDYILVSRP